MSKPKESPIFRLWVRETRRGEIRVEDVCTAGLEPDLFMAGRSLQGLWSDRIVVRVSGERPLDIFHGGLLFPLLSQRAKEFVESAGLTGAEWHPVRIEKVPDGAPLERPYWFANALAVPGAIDMARSVWCTDCPKRYHSGDGPPPPGVAPETAHFMMLVVRLGRVAGRDMFRLAEQPRVVYVSRHFVELAKQHRLTGVSFEPAHASPD